MLATVTDKGRVTAPKEIRDRTGIAPGSLVALESPRAVTNALADFEAGSVDFPDCLIVAKAGAAGCSQTLRCDKRMGTLPGVDLI